MTTAAPRSDHHVPLERTDWVLWRDVALRSTGFPAARFLELCDGEFAAAADALNDGRPDAQEQYAAAYTAATDRLSAAIRRTATERRFRAAVTWQNPDLVGNCLDKAAAGESRNGRGRAHELTIASYLQRYCLKNDTIGFFGPVGWARIEPEDAGLTATPGPRLLARRTTYFEDWAIHAVAAAIAAWPEVWPWLRPRIAAYASVTGRVLRLPFRAPKTLSVAEARLLPSCDGRHTVRDIAGDPADPHTIAALLRLRDSGAVHIDLSGPLCTWPERALASRINAIGDPGVRARAAAVLDEIVGARDAVAVVGDQSDELARASRMLAETFERITNRKASRRAGQVYAGRTLVCEDAVRDVRVRLGRRVTEALAAPLGPVLDSARWLANTIADRYVAAAAQVLDRQLARSGRDTMPLLQLMAGLVPELFEPSKANAGSEIMRAAVVEFQQRWRRVLGLPLHEFDRARHQVTAAALAAGVAQEFATGPSRWSAARWHSPDVMVAAADASALARGDVDLILGELHCASNTLESSVFVAQHPANERLRAAAAASRQDGRIVFIPHRDAELVSFRTSRAPDILLPSYTFVCIGSESIAAPEGARVVSALDLAVQRQGAGLIVRHRDGGEFDFLEIIGESIATLLGNAFRPIGGAWHQPRVTIDRLVLSREAWTLPAAEPTWAFVKNERERYARARRWRATHGLPERAFFRVPVERKPMAVDFRSLPLVNLLAKSIRRAAEAGPGEVTITEMMPDIDQLWLTDARGQRYTAELRFVAVQNPADRDVKTREEAR